MHRWYVKARYQTDHEERAAALGCEIILEDTSAQVDPTTPLPHVIVQTSAPDDASLNTKNFVFAEPTTRQAIAAGITGS